MKTTFSIIKADVGGWPGHALVNPELKKIAYKRLIESKRSGILKDFYVTHCGDDLELIMTHINGVEGVQGQRARHGECSVPAAHDVEPAHLLLRERHVFFAPHRAGDVSGCGRPVLDGRHASRPRHDRQVSPGELRGRGGVLCSRT